MANTKKSIDDSQIPVNPDSMSVTEVENILRTRLREAQSRQALLANHYKKEKTRVITIAPSYKRYVGRVMTRSINGVLVAVPADGKPYEVPESFAAEWDRTREYLDMIDARATSSDEGANIAEDRGVASPQELLQT